MRQTGKSNMKKQDGRKNYSMKNLEKRYELAKEQYSYLDVDVDSAIEKLSKIPISLHCWQGDDVGGFETVGAELSGGGIQTTGNYPGKARTLDELRGDIEKALSLIPGKHRLNLHACYLDNGGKYVDRNEMTVELEKRVSLLERGKS